MVDSIDKSLPNTVEEVKDQMQQTQEAILDMLSPTDPRETFDKELEEELEVEDDTFEL